MPWLLVLHPHDQLHIFSPQRMIWVFQQGIPGSHGWSLANYSGELSCLTMARDGLALASQHWPPTGGIDGSVEETLSVPVGRIGHLIGKAGWGGQEICR